VLQKEKWEEPFPLKEKVLFFKKAFFPVVLRRHTLFFVYKHPVPNPVSYPLDKGGDESGGSGLTNDLQAKWAK